MAKFDEKITVNVTLGWKAARNIAVAGLAFGTGFWFAFMLGVSIAATVLR